MKKQLGQNIGLVAIAILVFFAAHTALSEYRVQATDVFEVASVKPAGEAAAESLARFGDGCDGGFPRVDHKRFTVTTTTFALLTWAYGFNNHGGCSYVTRKPVVDRAGLSGEYTFDLEFSPTDPNLGESSAASVFTAVQEQLGLKLESAKVPAEIIVIDYAEKPSEN